MLPAQVSSTGFSRAKIASLAPTMVSSVPSQASFGVRPSGASTKWMPDRREFRRERERGIRIGGRAVDDDGALAQARLQAVAPRAIASTSREPVTQRKTMVERAARSLALRPRARRARRDPRSAFGCDGRARQLVALLDDVLGHAVAHQAQPDEADGFIARRGIGHGASSRCEYYGPGRDARFLVQQVALSNPPRGTHAEIRRQSLDDVHRMDFLDRFAAAADAGFDAVEFQFPYPPAPTRSPNGWRAQGLTRPRSIFLRAISRRAIAGSPRCPSARRNFGPRSRAPAICPRVGAARLH